MSATIRTITTVVDETLTEAGRPVTPATRVAIALAVVANPWVRCGFVADLSPLADEVASELGKLLDERVRTALGAPVEAYGAAAIVGLDGELEHGCALLGALRDVPPSSVQKRAPAGATFDIPLTHVTDPALRSHQQSVEARLADAPRADEIIIGLAAATGGRPLARRVGSR
jgi:amino acid synthesis protein